MSNFEDEGKHGNPREEKHAGLEKKFKEKGERRKFKYVPCTSHLAAEEEICSWWIKRRKCTRHLYVYSIIMYT